MMVDSALVQLAPREPSSMDRLDAAHALLGASELEPLVVEPAEEQQEVVVNRRPRSGSVGLDELAELAAGMDRQQIQFHYHLFG